MGKRQYCRTVKRGKLAMSEKKNKDTTMHVSIETKGKIDSIIREMEEILGCKVSYDKYLRILHCLRDKEMIRLV